MAELNVSATQKSKRRLGTPRVDLTPMVDLGFLLITFFMYTTTMAEPKVVDINMPFNSELRSEIPEESTLTIIPTGNHKCYYYTGFLPAAKSDVKISNTVAIRQVIRNTQQDISKQPATFSKEAHRLHVLIKPDNQSKYNDLVAILDEMLINDVPYYVIMDVSKEEQRLLE